MNAIDVLTIIAVVAMLTMLLRASLAKQGYTVAEPFNWMRATAVHLAYGTADEGTAVAANSPLPPRSAASRPAAGAANASGERIRIIPVTNYSWSTERSKREIAKKRSGRGQPFARRSRNDDPPRVLQSDERIAFAGDASWENPLPQ
ncbi:MAG: hypothetical protein ACREQQ_03250 [Candidatus Binatia bacterium]